MIYKTLHKTNHTNNRGLTPASHVTLVFTFVTSPVILTGERIVIMTNGIFTW